MKGDTRSLDCSSYEGFDLSGLGKDSRGFVGATFERPIRDQGLSPCGCCFRFRQDCIFHFSVCLG